MALCSPLAQLIKTLNYPQSVTSGLIISAVLIISLAIAGFAIFLVNRFLTLFSGKIKGKSHFKDSELYTLSQRIRRSESGAQTKELVF